MQEGEREEVGWVELCVVMKKGRRYFGWMSRGWSEDEVMEVVKVD
jgi:hypothetical protein